MLGRGKMHKNTFRWKTLRPRGRPMYRSDGYIKDLKQMGLCRLYFSGPEQGQVANFFEHFLEPFG